MFNNFFKTVQDGLFKPSTVIVNDSPKKTLNSTDWGKLATKVVIGSVLAGLAILADYTNHLDLGSSTALIVPLLMSAYEAYTKYLRDYQAKLNVE